MQKKLKYLKSSSVISSINLVFRASLVILHPKHPRDFELTIQHHNQSMM
jgi:hypothetical protein